MTSPTSGSAAEIAATAAICSRVSTGRAVDLICSTIVGLDAALDDHRVGPGRDDAEAFAHERLAEHDGGGRAVTGDVVGLGRDLLEELGAHVLERVVELDVTGDGHAVVGDRRRTEFLVEDDVAALGADGDLDGVGEAVDAPLERTTSGLVEEDLLSQCLCSSQGIGVGVGRVVCRQSWTIARMSF